MTRFARRRTSRASRFSPVLLSLGVWSLLNLAGGLQWVGRVSMQAISHPERLYLDPLEQKMDQYGSKLTDLDLQAAREVRRRFEPHDRMLLLTIPPGEPNLIVKGILVGVAGIPNVGAYLYRARREPFTDVWPLGFRATAFVHSADPEILRDLNARWVVVRPDLLPERARQRLESDPAYERVWSEQGGDQQGRMLYEFRPAIPRSPKGGILGGRLTVTDVHSSTGWTPGEYAQMQIAVENPTSQPLLLEDAVLSYRLLDTEGACVTCGDEIPTRLALALPARGGMEVPLHFVAPHEPGAYRISWRIRVDDLPVGLESVAEASILVSAAVPSGAVVVGP